MPRDDEMTLLGLVCAHCVKEFVGKLFEEEGINLPTILKKSKAGGADIAIFLDDEGVLHIPLVDAEELVEPDPDMISRLVL